MGRLIDADSLIGCAIIRPTSLEDIEHINTCKERISHNDIPTAYDVDKVVAEITSSAFWNAGVLDLDVTERIVRKGGVNVI